MLSKIKGIIFDMDGTLIDSLCIWKVIWEEFDKRFSKDHKFKITPSDDKAVRTMTLKGAMDYIHSRYLLGRDGEELLGAAEEIIGDFYAHTVRLKEGVGEFLDCCHSRGIRMCVASATDMHLLNLAMDHCGIRGYFDAVISCADVGKGKDEPDIYFKALEILGTSLHETWVFEDSHIALKTAHSIGMNTVGIYDENNFGYDEIRKIATVCIGDGESVTRLMESVPKGSEGEAI